MNNVLAKGTKCLWIIMRTYCAFCGDRLNAERSVNQSNMGRKMEADQRLGGYEKHRASKVF